MKGMIFVEVISGQISGQGIVADQVGPGFYKLTWQSEPDAVNVPVQQP